jgi:hypothetical protein
MEKTGMRFYIFRKFLVFHCSQSIFLFPDYVSIEFAQWAHIVILLERSFSAKELKKFQETYSLKLPSPNNDGKNTLALMVIKKTKHTKAFIRQNALKNWRVRV